MYKKQLMFFASLLMLFSAFFFGCDQEKFDAGLELVPDSLRIDTKGDTIPVEAYTYKVEKLQTNSASKVLVGEYTDPILGKISASFVTEMIPQDTSVSRLRTDSTLIDDLILYLRYPLSDLRFYGDPTKPIKINVMRINKYLSYQDTIYSNFEPTELDQAINPFASKTFYPDSIIYYAEKEASQKYEDLLADTVDGKIPDTANIERPDPVALLAIKLPNEWRDEIKNLVYNSIKDYATFAQQFNGLYITTDDSDPDTVPQSISIFDYTDTETKVSLNFHYDSDTTDMGRSYDFNLGAATTRFNLYEQTYLPGIENHQSNEQSNVVYIHGIAGLKAKIVFPNLDEIIDEARYAVNRAELIFQVQNEDTISYPVPDNLILKRIADENEQDEEGYLTEYFQYDRSGVLIGYSGATHDEGEYKFDITLYMQKVFKGEYDNNGLFLSIPDEATNPSRVVLTSGNHTTNNIKLKLTLTKLSN